jgi:hypothetical protein
MGRWPLLLLVLLVLLPLLLLLWLLPLLLLPLLLKLLPLDDWAGGEGVLHLRDVLPAADFERVRAVCSALDGRLAPDEESYARGLESVVLGEAERVLLDGALEACAAAVERACGGGSSGSGVRLIWGAPAPPEYRRYTLGSRMPKHRDMLVFGEREPPQLECVLTLSNTSDSVTRFRGGWSRALGFRGRLVAVRTEPNSVLVVRAEGAEHDVTRVGVGERTILKFACRTA